MKTAKLVSKKETETGMRAIARQRHYKLSEPLDGHEYVIVSSAYTWDHGDETYIFGANENGEIVEWGELEGSYVGGLDHEIALRSAGYEVVNG